MSSSQSPARPGAAAWQPWLPLVAVLAAVFWLFRDTAAAMVAIWSRSDTFAHAFLVPPIALWLLWRMRGDLQRAELRPAPLWLVPMALVCLLWLLGELIGVNAATQLALVMLIVMSVPAVLGWAVARRAAFPMLFLFFAVPLGEFLVPSMMEGTADFTVFALRLSGIPVYREGLQFVIPSGNWSVVEACSGVRYLIASVMVGTLFAYLNFRSPMRRLAFVAVAIAVPIVANWLRAYLIVMLGHLSSNKLAAGADHLIYGWVFFGVVIGVMFLIGARYADASTETSASSARALAAHAGASRPAGRRSWVVGIAVVLLVLVAQGTLARLERPGDCPAPALALPIEFAGGWSASDSPLADWVPAWQNPSAVASRTYRSGSDVVAVWVGYYRDQGYQRKLVSSTNVLVGPGAPAWLLQPRGTQTIQASEAAPVVLRGASLRTPADPKVSPTQRLQVLRVYWLGGRWVAGDVEARVRLAFQRLMGGGDDSAVLIVYAPVSDPDRSITVLDTFLTRNLPALAAILDGVAPRH